MTFIKVHVTQQVLEDNVTLIILMSANFCFDGLLECTCVHSVVGALEMSE